MSTDSTCPVCERQGLSLNSESCPQCDADLTCFQALDTLSAPPPAEQAEPAKSTAQGSSSNNRFALPALLLFLVIISLFFIFFSLKTRDSFQKLNQRVAELNTDLRTARRSNGPEEQKPEQTSPASGMNMALSKKVSDGNPVSVGENKDKVAVYTVTVEQRSAFAKPELEDQAGLEKNHNEQHGENQRTDTVVAERPDNGQREEPVRESEPTEQVETEAPQVAETAEIKKSPKTELEKNDHLPVAAPESLPTEKWREKTFLYQTKKTDTLWGIAEHFYGDGKYYPVIMEQNPGLVISKINNEETIRLLSDRTVLRNIYKRRTEWRDGLPLWKHKVLAGETRKSIHARFSSPGSSDRVFYSKNQPIVPGRAVRIILR
jgi:hypothetical protein